MNNRITITITGFGLTHNAELDNDVSAEQFIETCCKMAESLSYTPGSVIEGFKYSPLFGQVLATSK